MSIATTGNTWGFLQKTKQSTLLPSIQSWGVCCYVQVAETEAKLAMRGWGKESYIFPFFSWQHIRAKPNVG